MDLLERSQCNASRHPWELSRSRFFIRLIDRLAVPHWPVNLLDVGAGDAWFADQLTQALPSGSHATCWDTNYTPEDLVTLGGAVAQLSLTTEKPLCTFSGILMLDVIEHVADDVGFVAGIVRDCLEDDGWILISVPAYQRLFTSHDKAVKHYRRYSPHGCSDVLREAGLQVVAQGGLFQSLLAVRGAQAAREHLAGTRKPWAGPGAWSGGPRLTRMVTTTLDVESRFSFGLGARTGMALPGLSHWAFCRRAGR
jgi:hypothetical protein